MDKQNQISSFTWTHKLSETILTSLNLSPTYTDQVLDKNSDCFLSEEKVKRENLLRRPLKPLLCISEPIKSGFLYFSPALTILRVQTKSLFRLRRFKRERKWGANRKLALINKVISIDFYLDPSSAIRSQDIIDRITIFTAFGYKQVHGNSYLCNKIVK